MGQLLAGIGGLTDPSFSFGPAAAADASARAGAGAAAATRPAAEALRYSVEPGADHFVLIFKVVDAATDRVVSQTPFGSPQSVSRDPLYRAGALVDQSL